MGVDDCVERRLPWLTLGVLLLLYICAIIESYKYETRLLWGRRAGNTAFVIRSSEEKVENIQAMKFKTIYNQNCLQVVERMKEQVSQLQLNASEGLKMVKQMTKSFMFDPIEEIGIQVDFKNPEDEEELKKLIGVILMYPSSELAQMHSEAMRIGNYDLETPKQTKEKVGKTVQEQSQIVEDRKMCPCCGFVRQVEHIKICTPLDGVKNIGTSTQLYFATYKSLTILLGIMFLVYSIYAIISSGIAAKGRTQIADYIKISLAAKQLEDTESNRNLYYAQCWVGLLTILIWILMMIGIKYNQIKEGREYDSDTSSCSDYSVVLEGIPLDITKDELQRQLNGYYNSVVEYRKIPERKRKPFKIMKLNVAKPFYLSEEELKDNQIKAVEKEIQKYREQFVEWVLERRDRNTFSEPKEKRQETYQKYQKAIIKKIELFKEEMAKIKKHLHEEKSGELTTAFVTFETNLARDLMVELNEVTFYSRVKGVFGDKNKFVLTRGDRIIDLKIDIAPEPEDIKWTNVGISDCSTYMRKLFTYAFTLCLLGGSFGIVYALSKQQNQLNKNDPNSLDPASRYLSIAISLVIALTNVVIGQVIKFLTAFERDYTNTFNQASLAVKSIFAQMINSILIPVIVAYYIKGDIYGSSGLVDNIFIMSFSTALVAPLVVLFDPVYIMQKVKKCWKTRVASKITQNQKDHNSLYEGIQFEVGYEYIYIGNVFMFNCFFVSLQPVCVVGALLGYLMMYWVQKYCMFYRYRRPVPSSDFVNQAVWQIIHIGPLLFSLGSLTWANFLPEGFPKSAIVPNLIALGFSILLIIVPIKPILMGCFFDDDTAALTYYEENRITFSSEYDRLNPSTQEEGLKEYQEFSVKFVQNYKKLSVEKQAELAKMKINNDQRGQLNQFTQVNHNQGFNFGMFGGQDTGNIFTSLIQQSAPNSYQPIPQPNQHAAPQAHQQQIQKPGNNQVAPYPQAQDQPNPFAALFGGGVQPQPQARAPAPMGGMPMPGMGMPGMGMPGMGMPGMGMPMAPNYMNPMVNMMGGGMGVNPYALGGMRMW